MSTSRRLFAKLAVSAALLTLYVMVLKTTLDELRKPSASGSAEETSVPDLDSFVIDERYLDDVTLGAGQYLTLTEANVNDFVFVTAASDEFSAYVVNAIATVQEHFPNRTIIVYDLNVDGGELHNDVKQICNVKYRKFPFAKYPHHVMKLQTYAWKPLIILEVLLEYPGLLWFDSSVRFLSDKLGQIFPKVLATDGVLLFNDAGHNAFSVTHPHMFRYLNTDLTRLQATVQYEANVVMLYRTRAAFDDVIRPWAVCALVADCMAPTASLRCRTDFRLHPARYAGCHRFDQSAINILVAHRFNYSMAYAGHVQGFEEIRRLSRHGRPPKLCRSAS